VIIETPDVKYIDEHDIEIFHCSECSNQYKYLSSLKSHAKKSHAGIGWQQRYSNVIARARAVVRNYACPMCDACCASWYGLRRHMTTRHPNDRDDLQLFYLVEDICIQDNPTRKEVIASNQEVIDELCTRYHIKRKPDVQTIPDSDVSTGTSEMDNMRYEDQHFCDSISEPMVPITETLVYSLLDEISYLRQEVELCRSENKRRIRDGPTDLPPTKERKLDHAGRDNISQTESGDDFTLLLLDEHFHSFPTYDPSLLSSQSHSMIQNVDESSCESSTSSIESDNTETDDIFDTLELQLFTV
jgi:hypothetical protein